MMFRPTTSVKKTMVQNYISLYLSLSLSVQAIEHVSFSTSPTVSDFFVIVQAIGNFVIV